MPNTTFSLNYAITKTIKMYIGTLHPQAGKPSLSLPEPELAQLCQLPDFGRQVLELVVLQVEGGELGALPDLGR